MKKLILAAAGAALALVTAQAAAAVLVVKSSGPSAKLYPAGKKIPDSGKIKLKRNDVVVVLDARGTRTLRGPGTFDASASSGKSASALAAVSGRTTARRRVGATRGTPTGATMGRNIWQADIARSGNVCFVNPVDTGLYRADAEQAATVTIRNKASGESATVEFEAGQRNASWPSNLPVTAGQSYELSGGGSTITLNAKSIEPAPAGMEAIAQGLIVNGCQAQLDVLIDTFTSSSAG